ncbi:MAG: hypothetical protein ACODAF_08250, partial [Actinomycetota bacterium]
AVIALGAAWALSGDDGGQEGTAEAADDVAEDEADAQDDPADEPAGATEEPSEPPEETAEPELPADEQCTDEIMANDRWVCITSATIADDQLTIEYDAEWAGDTPNTDGGFHVHFYGADESGTEPPAEIMGTHAADQGDWYIEDQQPSVHPLGSNQANEIGDAPKVCARIADGNHALVPDSDGGYNTGNCWPIERAGT